jgi:hypothetical protein
MQKIGKYTYTKGPQNLPNLHKIHQATLKIPNGHKICQKFSFQILQKYIKIDIFGLKIYHLAALTRVTRLGEFSPIGRLFSLGSIVITIVVAQILGLLFHNTCYISISFDKKPDWATLWAFFSQTHLVTLLVT